MVTTTLPPAMTLAEMASAFLYSSGVISGDATLFGFLLLAVLTTFVFLAKGMKFALFFVLVAIPIFCAVGLLPVWLRFIDYVIVVILAIMMFREVNQ